MAVITFRSRRAVRFVHRVADYHCEFSARKGTHLLRGFSVVVQMDSVAEIAGSVCFLISPAILERVFATASVMALTAKRFNILVAAP